MARKGGLGKGLDALIPGGENYQTESGITNIPIDRIVPNPRQPRTGMNQIDLEELAASIREHGVLQPIIISKGSQPEDYILIAGERRWRASKLAGLDFIPAIIREVSQQQQLELALIENVQRSDLGPLETAEAYRQLAEDFKLSHEEIAQRVGKNRTTITNSLRLLKLPQAALSALAEGRITEGHARSLLALPTVQAQLAALQTVLNQGLSVRQTEELIRKLNGQRSAHPVKSTESPEIKDIEGRLCQRLGTKVSLTHGKKGGTVTIHYYSDEELDSLISQILKD
jgi:ParB family transcriptional regulator, chromosome partitioning protein